MILFTADNYENEIDFSSGEGSGLSTTPNTNCDNEDDDCEIKTTVKRVTLMNATSSTETASSTAEPSTVTESSPTSIGTSTVSSVQNTDISTETRSTEPFVDSKHSSAATTLPSTTESTLTVDTMPITKTSTTEVPSNKSTIVIPAFTSTKQPTETPRSESTTDTEKTPTVASSTLKSTNETATTESPDIVSVTTETSTESIVITSTVITDATIEKSTEPTVAVTDVTYKKMTTAFKPASTETPLVVVVVEANTTTEKPSTIESKPTSTEPSQTASSTDGSTESGDTRLATTLTSTTDSSTSSESPMSTLSSTETTEEITDAISTTRDNTNVIVPDVSSVLVTPSLRDIVSVTSAHRTDMLPTIIRELKTSTALLKLQKATVVKVSSKSINKSKISAEITTKILKSTAKKNKILIKPSRSMNNQKSSVFTKEPDNRVETIPTVKLTKDNEVDNVIREVSQPSMDDENRTEGDITSSSSTVYVTYFTYMMSLLIMLFILS